MRYLSLIATIAFLPLCAFSQMSPTGPTNTPGTNSSVPHQYVGCLQQSNGNLKLVEPSGRSYDLVSSSVSLKNYAGEGVKIVASNIVPGDPSSDEHAIVIGESPHARTLDVSDISQATGQCSQQR